MAARTRARKSPLQMIQNVSSNDQKMLTVRILKFIVQPVIALDDGDSLTEQMLQPIQVSPKDWHKFANEIVFEQIAKIQEQIDAGPGGLPQE